MLQQHCLAKPGANVPLGLLRMLMLLMLPLQPCIVCAANPLLCIAPQGLAPLAAVPELERSIVCRGGSINYKHFYVPAAQFEADASCDDGAWQQQQGCSRRGIHVCQLYHGWRWPAATTDCR